MKREEREQDDWMRIRLEDGNGRVRRKDERRMKRGLFAMRKNERRTKDEKRREEEERRTKDDDKRTEEKSLKEDERRMSEDDGGNLDSSFPNPMVCNPLMLTGLGH